MYIMPFDPHLDAKRPASKVRAGPGEPAQAVREAILNAASEAFAQEGYAATTVSSIALKAGLPKSNVLYYFKSKEAIYTQVLGDIAPSYLDACMPCLADGQPLEALTRTVIRMIRLFEQQPFAAKVLMIELREGARRLPGDYFTRWTAQAQDCLATLRQWIDRGLLAPLDPEHVLLTVWSIAQSCVSLGWQIPNLRGQDIDYDAAACTAARLLLNGLAPAGCLGITQGARLPA
ncbi:TetR family transcriptional regulator C-terminal domain-containing protein [Pseudomonas sp. X10]